MRAVVLESFGEPEVLKVADIPDPTPGPDEVIVEVAATALNRADLLQRRGGYPGPKLVYGGQTFDIPGMELSGRVVDRGSRVTEWDIDEAVMAIVSGGAYAERCAVHERQLLSVPFSVPTLDAAAIPEVFITAWDALVVQGGLTSGRSSARACGGVGRRHRRHPDREGDRSASARHDVGGQGRGVRGARRGSGGRLPQRRLRRGGARVHGRAWRRCRPRRHRR